MAVKAIKALNQTKGSSHLAIYEYVMYYLNEVERLANDNLTKPLDLIKKIAPVQNNKTLQYKHPK